MADLLYKAQTRFLFHAHIKIKVSVFYEDAVFDELFGVLEGVDKAYNSYSPGSYIDRINSHAGSFVEVDDETVGILRRVIGLSDFFDGEFDITVMPLIRLWGFYKNEDQRIPSPAEIAEVKQAVDYRRIEIDGNRVRIACGQEIITGAFIKAYAVDKLVQHMRRKGITDAIVNAGGSTITGINDQSHPQWQVVVRNPMSGEPMFNISLRNNCFSTSSQDKTFVTIDGRQYGHILSPKTGFPSTTRQVGIVSDDCTTGDIVSTGVYNLAPEAFLETMERLAKIFPIEGFLMDERGGIVKTKGFDQYIKE